MECCCLCAESYDSDELIEVKDGLLKLRTGIVKLFDVISNVFLARVDHLNVICVSCKSQIINFYNFKENVIVNLDPLDAQKIEVIEGVKEFLNTFEDRLTLLKHENSLSIVPTNSLEIADTSEGTNEAAQWTDEVLLLPCVEIESERDKSKSMKTTMEREEEEEEGFLCKARRCNDRFQHKSNMYRHYRAKHK